MKHIDLGGRLDVSRIGLGCMGMSAYYTGAGDDEANIRVIHRAIDLGVTFFDTAEVYGPYTNEELVGRALTGKRDQVVLATKFGMLNHRTNEREFNGRRENVRESIELSLERLGTDHVDLFYQHRMDPNTPIEETAGALGELIDEGKILGYGLSEAAAATVRRAHAVRPITALQNEYSLWTRDPEDELIPLVKELGIGLVPYSPLGRGFLTGTIRSVADLDEADFRKHNPRFEGENLVENIRIVEKVDAIAREVGAAPGQVALAWLLAQGDFIAPIPGTTKIANLEQNVAADEVVLTPEHLAQLSAVGTAVGNRYPDMSALNRDTPLPE